MEIGQKVEHKLSKDWLLILDVIVEEDVKSYICRTKGMEIVQVYDFEVKTIQR